MAEWLVLLLLVPAIVVPVVLLVGFAGCDQLFGIGHFNPGIFLDKPVGKTVNRITLSWSWSDAAPLGFHLERTNPDFSTTPLDVSDPATRSIDDHNNGLNPNTNYSYTVSVVQGDGAFNPTSASAIGTTLAFETTFDETGKFSVDSSPWEGFTLVQRIEAAALMPISRTQVAQVRITLYASSMGDASIDRIFISAPATGGNLYDSAADLTEVPLIVEGDTTPSMPLVVPANRSKTLRGVNYIVQPQSQPLLIAVDFTNSSTTPPPSAVREAVEVAARAVAFWRKGAPEAGRQMRTAGYQPGPAGAPAVYLIGKVEIG
jgi:hypothetical protein